MSVAWDTIHSSFSGGWVVRKQILNESGQVRYTDFPESTYGVLDSQTVTAHETKEAADAAMIRLRAGYAK